MRTKASRSARKRNQQLSWERVGRTAPDPPDRPRRLPPPPAKPKLRFDKTTRDNLAYLAGECRAKVPCAQEILNWSKRAQLDTEREEIADAAVTCAQRCRLK